MKKNFRMMLSLLLVLALCLQFTGTLALADDVDVSVSGQESLVYELRVSDSGNPDSSVPVSAEEEAEKLQGKAYSVAVGSADSGSNSSLSREPSGFVLGDLVTKDLIITPPEGYYVSRAYLRGDEVGSQQLKTLPFTAQATGARIVLKAGAVANSSNSFDKKYLTTGSHADPQVYTLTLVFSPLDTGSAISVTEAMDAYDYGSQYTVMPGSGYTAPANPGDSDQRVFAGWKLSYGSGAALMLDPGQSFSPYADCRLEAQWKQVVTVSANAPYESDGQFYTNGWSYTGQLADGDYFDSVSLSIAEQADGFVAVPSGAVILNNGRNVTDNYILRYENSYAVQKASVPTPEPVYITVKANAPVTYDGVSYMADGAALTEGALNYGDGFASIQIDVVRNDDGSYIAVPRDAVIMNGGADTTSAYIISYLASDPVYPPVEKVKLTVKANEPVTYDGGKTYVPDSATLIEGALNYGDGFASIQIDVVRNDDGTYVAVPRDAVIQNGGLDKTEDYEITYLASDPVTPPPPEKVKLTVKAMPPITNDRGKTYQPDSATLTEGALNYGDGFTSIQIDVEATEDGAYIAVPHDAVIMNGDADVTGDYEITYLPSDPIYPPEKVKLTFRANAPVTYDGGKTYVADGAELIEGAVNYGDALDSVQIDVQMNENGDYVAVPRDAVILSGGADVTEDYEISYVASDPVTPPAPEKVKLTVKANAPITYDEGKTYVPDSATLTEGALNEGDAFASVQIDVLRNDDGTYVAIPRDAVILNGGADVTGDYEISYLASDPVTPPAPEKVKITIKANAPVTNDEGKTYAADGAAITEGALNEGDVLDSVQIDVQLNEDGDYVAIPRDAVIRNGDADKTGDYEISYLPSDPVTPPVEKVKLSITAREPVTNDGGKTYVPDSAALTEGALNPGDGFSSVQIDVESTEDGGYIAVPHDAVIMNGSTDVTENYVITYVASSPVYPPAEKVKITIKANAPVTNDGGKTYVADGAALTEGALNEGDVLDSVQIDVQLNENGDYVAVPRDASIVNGYVDKTGDYEISYLPSDPVTPPVEKVKLTVVAKEPVTNDGGKTYVPDSALLTEGTLKSGDSFTGIQIDVVRNDDGGYVAVPRDAVIMNGSTDVTENYEITYVSSSPVYPPAEKVKITITAKEPVTHDGGRTYSPDSAMITEGTLNAGDVFDSVQIDVQQNENGNYIAVPRDAVIKNGYIDNTAKYEITYLPSGEVVPPPPEPVALTVTAQDQTWTYDGTAHKADPSGYTISGLTDGDEATVTLLLSQGENSAESVVSAGTYSIVPQVTLRTRDGGAVDEGKYALQTISGVLIVKKQDITLEAVSASKTYNGLPLVNDNVKAPPLAAGHKYQSVTLQITDAEGKPVTGGVKDAGDYTKTILEVRIVDAGGQEVTDNYNITRVDGTLTVNKLDITLEAESVSRFYDGTAFTDDAVKLPGLPSGHKFDSVVLQISDGDGKTYPAGVTEVGVYTKKITEVRISDADGRDVSGNFNISTVDGTITIKPRETVKLTITANEPITNDGGKTYLPNDAVITEGALNPGDALASVQIDVEKDADGNYVATPRDAVIKSGEIVTTLNYEITYVPSKPVTPPEQKIELTLRSKDRSAEYSGQLITADDYVLVNGALAEGDTMEVTYSGGSTNITANPIPSIISSVVIKDALGNDVTASKYSVTIDNENPGKVTVTQRPITVTAISGTVETDGTKVIYAKDCKTANGAFVRGHKVEGLLEGHELRGDFVKGYGSQTFTTSIDLSVLRVVDVNNNIDVTANYLVHTVNGTMTIKVSSSSQTGVPVAVTVKDQSWVYDGVARKPSTGEVSVSGLLDGDVASITLRLKQGDSLLDSATNAGSYTIVPEVSIRTKDGNPVAANKYSINIIGASGTLTIKKLDITLEAVSDSKSYDGKPLVNEKVKAPSLPSGHKYQSVKLNYYNSKGNLISGGVKDVGTYTKRIADVVIVNASGVDVTSNFNITKIDGKLTILSSSMNDSTSPKTGDSSMTGFIVAIIVSALLLVGIGAAFLVTSKRKRLLTDPDPDDDGFEPIDPDTDWQEPDESQQNWNSTVEQIFNDAPQQNWDAAPEQTWTPAPEQTWDATPDLNWDAAPQQNDGSDFDFSWLDEDTSLKGDPENTAPETTLDWPDDDVKRWDDPPKHIPKH